MFCGRYRAVPLGAVLVSGDEMTLVEIEIVLTALW